MRKCSSHDCKKIRFSIAQKPSATKMNAFTLDAKSPPWHTPVVLLSLRSTTFWSHFVVCFPLVFSRVPSRNVSLCLAELRWRDLSFCGSRKLEPWRQAWGGQACRRTREISSTAGMGGGVKPKGRVQLEVTVATGPLYRWGQRWHWGDQLGYRACLAKGCREMARREFWW